MEHTPTVCADDLPTILGILKNDPTSRSVNIVSSSWILIHFFVHQPKLCPATQSAAQARMLGNRFSADSLKKM